MGKRQTLSAHMNRLGWDKRDLAAWLSDQTSDTVSVYTVRSWLAPDERTYSRACPGWPIRLIELVDP